MKIFPLCVDDNGVTVGILFNLSPERDHQRRPESSADGLWRIFEGSIRRRSYRRQLLRDRARSHELGREGDLQTHQIQLSYTIILNFFFFIFLLLCLHTIYEICLLNKHSKVIQVQKEAANIETTEGTDLFLQSFEKLTNLTATLLT